MAPTDPDLRLGQLLVERGELTAEELERALGVQRRDGGRLGTCLLELGLVSEEALEKALAGQLGVASIGADRLRSVDTGVLRLVPARVAVRYRAIPVTATDAEIEVAVAEVADLVSLDELAFCTGRRVRPRVAPEARIYEALERYYGEECPRRYERLLDRLNRSRYLWRDRPAGGGGAAKAPADPLADTLTLKLDDVFLPPPSARPARSDPRPSPKRAEARAEVFQKPPEIPGPEISFDAGAPASLGNVEALLAGEVDPPLVGEVALRCLAASFSRSALFQIRRQTIRGWLARGLGVDLRRFESLTLRLDQPSIFLSLEQGADSYLGPLAPMPIHRQMVSAWGGAMPRECLMTPVRIRGRLVAVLYGDRGSASLTGVDPRRFESLAQTMAAAFERCLLRKKSPAVASSNPSRAGHRRSMKPILTGEEA